jgi:hypothetical protein
MKEDSMSDISEMKKLIESLNQYRIGYVDLDADGPAVAIERKDLEGLPTYPVDEDYSNDELDPPVVTFKSFKQVVAGFMEIDKELQQEGFTEHCLGDAPEIRISIGPRHSPLSMKARKVWSCGGYGGPCIGLSAELNLEGELLQEWMALRAKIIKAGQGWE